ncbi:hypothetical protein GOP47_0026298 [Adiantum capillus-veneris]|nr:hypothetical protein GOP47_0026298 [Adiantum capillus-veneris]
MSAKAGDEFWMQGTTQKCNRAGRDWGKGDMMFDLADAGSNRQQWLQAAATFSGSLYLICLGLVYDKDMDDAFWKSFHVSGTQPKRLFVLHDFHSYTSSWQTEKLEEWTGIIELLNRRTSMEDLVLFRPSFLCLLSPVTKVSLRSLHLVDVLMDLEFMESLANLDESLVTLHSLTLQQSPLASKMFKPCSEEDSERMYDQCQEMSLSPCFNKFLEWPLEYLALTKFKVRPGDVLISMKALQRCTETPLHTFFLGNSPQLSNFNGCPTNFVGLVVDALHCSGLPHLYLIGSEADHAIEAQLLQNQKKWPLRKVLHSRTPGSEQLHSKVPAAANTPKALHSKTPGSEQLHSKVPAAAYTQKVLHSRTPSSEQLHLKVPAAAIRLFICGDAYAGKTTLLTTMSTLCSERNFVHNVARKLKVYTLNTLKGSKRTRGIEVRSLVRKDILVSIWDMAGQKEFHAFHDHMFPDFNASFGIPAMFMFVWSPVDSESHKNGERKEGSAFEASFSYWLKFIASKTRQSSVRRKLIVVLTRKDQMDFVQNALGGCIRALSTSFSGLVDMVEVFDVDARSPKSVGPVVSCMFNVAKDLLAGIEVYSICSKISQYLTQLADEVSPIIAWDLFSNICATKFKIFNDEVQKAIASYLHESGDIIYVNNLHHVILKPDWFCHEIMGSLIHFDDAHMSRIIPIRGYAEQEYLEKLLAMSSHSNVSGAVLVELMAGMHICYRVPNDPHGTVLIPTTLPLTSIRLHWRGAVQGQVHEVFTYVGRRLKCAKEDLTFLTPGLFPMIQVVFSRAFAEAQTDVKLHRDFLSIYIRDIEVLINFGLARGGHVIDVLMRAPLLTQFGSTLTHVREEIVGTLIRICAQPVGNQGVKLVENVIRPDCLHDPSPADEITEDQCVPLEHLKQRLRWDLEQGRSHDELTYVWKGNDHMKRVTDSFVDLLGVQDYMEILGSYSLSLRRTVECAFLKDTGDTAQYIAGEECIEESGASTSATFPIVDGDPNFNEDVDKGEDEGKELSIVATMGKAMARSISRKMEAMHAKLDGLKSSVDSLQETLRSRLEVIHRSIGDLRCSLHSAIETRVEQILHFGVEKEAGRVPRMVFLTTKGLGVKQRLLTTVFKDIKAVRIELFCEHRRSPHRVEGQKGLCVTALDEGLLKQALPYVNGFLSLLVLAAKGGAHAVGLGAAGSVVPDFTQLITHALAMEATLLDNLPSQALLKTLPPTAFMGWQQWLVSVLEQNGGMTESNIASKFMLRRALYQDTFKVAWLCKTHYIQQRPLPLV